MPLWKHLWILIQLLLSSSLLAPLIFYLIGSFRRNRKPPLFSQRVDADYAIIVTAYTQTDLIPEAVDSILKLRYTNFLIYVVADNCDVSDLHFDDNRVILLRPPEVLANNIKSHFYAIQHFQRRHKRIAIIDSDNLVDENMLRALNYYFDHGFKAVQGVRAAKNLDSDYACLDEAGDIFYRYIDRKLLFEAGSSASLAGSGMAFETDLYVDLLSDAKIEGAGFDKMFQCKIVESGERIAFSEKAVVYDGKTSAPAQLVKQRARWMNAWFKFFLYGIRIFWRGVFRADKNAVLFAIVLVRPPLFILMFFAFGFFVANIFLMPWLSVFWVFSVVVFIGFFFKALSYNNANEKIYQALKSIPKFVYYQILALLNARRASKLSVATEHKKT